MIGSGNLPGFRERKRPACGRGPFPENMPTHFQFKNRWVHELSIPKKSGGSRRILVPRGMLREAQDLALSYFMHRDKGTGSYPVSLLKCQTAYKRGTSAYDNAKAHEGYRISVKVDIKDFFDSIPGFPSTASKTRRYMLSKRVGDPKKITDPRLRRDLVQRVNVVSVYDALVYEGIPEDISRWVTSVGTFDGHLYQGSPLSPVLSNLVTKHLLCKRLLALASVFDLPVLEIEGEGLAVAFLGQPATKKVNRIGENRIHLFGFNDQGALARITKTLSGMRGSPKVAHHANYTEADVLECGNALWVGSRGYSAFLKQEVQRALKGNVIKRSRLGRTIMTIYADDIAFSGNNTRLPTIKRVIGKIMEDSGFSMNKRKGVKIMRSARHITGFDVGVISGNSTPHDTGVRVNHRTRDREYRVALHHMKTGKIPLTVESVQKFAGKLAYLKVPNPNSWAIFAKKFRDLVINGTQDPACLALVQQFDGV